VVSSLSHCFRGPIDTSRVTNRLQQCLPSVSSPPLHDTGQVLLSRAVVALAYKSVVGHGDDVFIPNNEDKKEEEEEEADAEAEKEAL
jgi:hypothetical protein